MRFAADTSFPRMNVMALVGMSSVVKTMSDGERKQIAEIIAMESEPVRERYSEMESVLAFELKTPTSQQRRSNASILALDLTRSDKILSAARSDKLLAIA